jgi:hypothetical protein
MPVSVPTPASQEAAHYTQNIIQIVGAFAVGYFTHILTSRRERKGGAIDRRREFLAFLKAWRVEVDRRHLEPGGFARDWRAHADVISEFRSAAEMVRKDFTGKNREKFESMVGTVANCNSHDYKKAAHEIDELIAFVDVG